MQLAGTRHSYYWAMLGHTPPSWSPFDVVSTKNFPVKKSVEVDTEEGGVEGRGVEGCTTWAALHQRRQAAVVSLRGAATHCPAVLPHIPVCLVVSAAAPRLLEGPAFLQTPLREARRSACLFTSTISCRQNLEGM